MEDEMFDMEITPQTLKIADSQATRSVDVKIIRVRVKTGSLATWKQVPVGTKVKFRAVLKMPMYIVLGEGRDAALIFKVDDAEPILPGQ